MKYYTKEWYNLSQQHDYHDDLRISEKAEVFSEEYYQNLYKRRLNKFLRFEKLRSKLTVDDIYGVESGKDDFNVVVEDSEMTKEERLQVAEDIKKRILDARANYAADVYDEKQLIRLCENSHKSHITQLMNTLPKEILENVVDIRVLALGITTKAIKKDIRMWCRKNSKETKCISCEYQKVLESNMNVVGIDILRNYGFHDCKIVSTECRNGNFIIELDSEGGFSSVNKVIFHNCSIIEKEGNLQGATWLYEEIYPSSTENGNEYHALIQYESGELAYLTVAALGIEFERGK